MSKEIVVDREQLQSNMQDISRLIEYIEGGYEYQAYEKQLQIVDASGKKIYEIEYLDLDAVHAQYSEVDLEIQTIGGITFVSSDNVVLECGILKDTLNDKSNTVVTDVIFGVTQWGK